MKFYKWLNSLSSLKSPCCNLQMTSVFDPLGNRIIYTCEKCKENYI